MWTVSTSPAAATVVVRMQSFHCVFTAKNRGRFSYLWGITSFLTRSKCGRMFKRVFLYLRKRSEVGFSTLEV